MTARLPCTHGCRHRARIVVCRQLRGLHPGSVLVILTARDDEMDVVVALDAAADESWSCAPASSICWRGSPLSRMLAHSGKLMPDVWDEHWGRKPPTRSRSRSPMPCSPPASRRCGVRGRQRWPAIPPISGRSTRTFHRVALPLRRPGSADLLARGAGSDGRAFPAAELLSLRSARDDRRGDPPRHGHERRGQLRRFPWPVRDMVRRPTAALGADAIPGGWCQVIADRSSLVEQRLSISAAAPATHLIGAMRISRGSEIIEQTQRLMPALRTSSLVVTRSSTASPAGQ